MKTLELKNAIKIDGKDVTKVTYDANEIDGVLFTTAEAKRKAAAGLKNTAIAPAAEFDFGLHLYLGYAAIIAVNPSIDFSDLERIKGADIREVMAIGRNFIFGSDGSQAKSSEKATETSDESITPALPSSNESE